MARLTPLDMDGTVRRALIAAIAIAVASSLFLIGTALEHHSHDAEIRRAQRSLEHIAAASQAASRYLAEARGEVIFRDPASRARSAGARASLEESLDGLALLRAQDPSHAGQLERLEAHAFALYAFHDAATRKSRAEALAWLESGGGVEHAAQIAGILRVLRAAQDNRLDRLRAAEARGELRMLFAMAGAAGAQLALVLLAYFAMRRELALRAAAEVELRRFRAALDLSSDAVYIIARRTMRIVDVNDAACRMLGYSREELLGSDPAMLFADPGLTNERLAALYDEAISAGVVRVQSRHRRKDGGIVPVEIHRTGLLANGEQHVVAVARDMGARRAVEQALRESEARYRALAEASPDAMLLHSDWKVAFANRAMCDLLGARDAAELVGRPSTFMLDAPFAEAAERRTRALYAGQAQPRAEQVYRRLDGTTVEVEIASAPATLEGRPAAQVTVRDISERRRLELERDTLAAEQRSLFENTVVGICHLRNRHVVHCNEAFARMFGYSPKELIGRSTRRLYGSEQRFLERRDDVYGALATRGRIDLDSEMQRRDGTTIWVSHSLSRIADSSDPTDAVWVARDISERKRAEAGIIEARRRMQLAIDASRACIWDTDLRTREVYLSEGWAGILGGEPEVTRTTLDELAAITHPDDLERVRAASLRVARSEAEEFSEEHRVRARGGDWIWVRTGGRVVERDAAGRAVRMMGTNFDVTRQKNEERRLTLEHAVTRALAEAESAAAGARAAMRALCEAEGWEAARYFSVDDAAGALRLRETWTRPGADFRAFEAAGPTQSFARGVGIAGRVWESGTPIWVPDVRSDSRVRNTALATQDNIRGLFVFPVASGTTIIGVIAVFTRVVRAPDERLLAAVGVIGSQLGQFLSRKQAEERAAHLAQFDALTELPNRSLFGDRLEQTLALARRNDWHVGVMLLDTDNFKRVNDSLGHAAGDELLRAIARRLQASLRAGDTVARFGGDEFAVLLPNLGSAEDAAVVAEKILEAMGAPFALAAGELAAAVSIGVAMHPADAADAATLLRAADLAMYRAKDAGRGRYRFFTAGMNDEAERRFALERDLRGALERGEFELHYQPKARVDLERITGVEALLRWRRAGAPVSPAQFIPVLEDTGLIAQVGDWVIREACRQLVAWNGGVPGRMRIAVNVSPRQFRDGGVIESVKKALAETGCAPGRLELEITESMLMHDVDVSAKALEELRAIGVRVSVDDFGTGYSSLAYLKRLPVDTIKIDRAFIKDLPANANDAAITGAIVAMARSLGYRTVAEGVETPLQRQFLEGCGCDEVQGYLLARPLPPRELADWLKARPA